MREEKPTSLVIVIKAMREISRSRNPLFFDNLSEKYEKWSFL
jgi:hypothetical protein